MTPGRGVPCRAMERMTRFVVASAAAARWHPALPALLPLLLAVPALRGSPTTGKRNKGGPTGPVWPPQVCRAGAVP